MFKAALLWLLAFCTISGQAGSVYKSNLKLTNDIALEDVLTDIPFFSVGLVGFATFTFFFVMRRLSRLTLYIHAAVLLGFLASILDVSQTIRRGSAAIQFGLGLNSVKGFTIARDICFSFSIGFRFFFYWSFIQEPPRGELPLLPVPDNRRPNFISLDSDSTIHSGSWAKWSFFGVFLKYSMLLSTITIPVLQILWRTVKQFEKAGPIYFTESGMRIVLSGLFILKLLANAYLSPLTPRWKTVRDYSPVLFPLLIAMGLATGDIFYFQILETSLGRLLQSVEMYILILFVLISSFYKMPVRSSVVAELVRRRLDSNGANDRQSMFSITPRPISVAPSDQAGAGAAETTQRSRSRRPSIADRLSSGSIFSSKLMARAVASTRPNSNGSGVRMPYGVKQDGEGDDRRLWDHNEAERGEISPVVSMRASLDQTPTQTPMEEVKQAQWHDPVFTSFMKSDAATTVTKPRSEVDFAPLSFRDSITPGIVIVDSPSAEQYPPTFEPARASSIAGSLESRSYAESPVYGLEGIVQSLSANADQQRYSVMSTQSSISDRSPGLDVLLRKQQELDRSIAGLKRFSTSTISKAPTRAGQPESMQSEFSLSNFPDPPFLEGGSPSSNVIVLPEPELSQEGECLVVDEDPMHLEPPRMSAITSDGYGRPQPQSIPSITRESLDSVLGSRGVRMDSHGTQYDVTSFIGGLTTAPAGMSESMGQSQLSGILEQLSDHSDSDNEMDAPATISDLKRVTVIENRRPSLAMDDLLTPTDSPMQSSPSTPKGHVASESITSALSYAERVPARLPSGQQGTVQPFVRPKGLPSGVRGRLEISNPIARNSSELMNEQGMYERPRPAPLVLQGPNDSSRAVVAPAKAVSASRRFF